MGGELHGDWSLSWVALAFTNLIFCALPSEFQYQPSEGKGPVVQFVLPLRMIHEAKATVVSLRKKAIF